MQSEIKADLIIKSGTVITMEEPVAARELDIAVKDGRFLAVEPAGSLDSLQGPETKIVDAAGQVVMPGLIDCHNHMALFGKNLQDVEVSPNTVSNLEELAQAIAARAAETPKGQWVKAWGYDNTLLAENDHPTRELLDRAAPENPVCLMRTCMHVMVVNSMALKMAGIADDAPDPEGGEFRRDDEGRVNGILNELGAMSIVHKVMPLDTADEVAQQLALASRVYASQGLTTVCEAGTGWNGNPQEATAFQKAREQGLLHQRVCLGMMETTHRLLAEDKGLGLYTGFGDERLWIGPAKFIGDGGIGGRTAAVNQPYEGSDYHGVMCYEAEELASRMAKVHAVGWQISLHSVGDRTFDLALDCYEKILTDNPRPHRHRIEHASITSPAQLARVAKLGLILVVQPAFMHYQGDSYFQNLGEQRMGQVKAVRSMLEAGITVAGSSDRPVTEGNPWTGIWSVLARTTVGGRKISPEQAITREQALRMWTSTSARVVMAEDAVGSIEAGKLADFILIDRNPLDCPEDDIAQTKVLKTYRDGDQVFAA
ncbi:MAG: amidohydrolase [Deltaproteobacteria bacterium]|nr:amidohydrolase [Deltaproteobacteria bacterium]